MSIVEVAKAAGVSTATVSRVMNNLPGVKADTIAQVKAAVAALNYKPQRVHSGRKKAARVTKLRTGSIAVITLGHGRTWLEMPILASAIGGIQRGADLHNLRLLLGEMSDPTKMSSLVTNRQIDGAVVFVPSEVPAPVAEATLKAMQKHVAVVWAMGTEMASGIDHVTPDNISVGYQAFNYLKRIGCRRFGFLAAHAQWPLTRLRGQAFMNSALDAGLIPSMHVVATDEHVIEAYGRHAVAEQTLEQLVDRFIKMEHRPDGVFIPTDFTTSYVYPLLAAGGLRVGRDVQIVSCDNEEARLSGMHPRPVSIDIGAEEVGYRAVQRLLNRIERPNGPPLVIQVASRLQIPASLA